MLNFVLCDDNKIILDRLSKVLESLFIKHNLDAEVSFTSIDPLSTLEYVKSNTVTAIFLDIDLKSNISGLDLASKIREIDNKVYIIFTSAHLEYILIAYKYKTFDFIPKPITSERLEETIIRIINDIKDYKIKTKFIRLSNRNTIINQDSVKYIKKDGMKLVFYTDTRKYETYSSFAKISNELPPNFIRCHKSYIANVDKITDIDTNNNLVFFDSKNNSSCYIGPKYKNKLMEVFNYDGNNTNNLDSIDHTK
ncbi:MAG: response regulator transcription factor [Clostridiaceae bacterium]|nr:response regulator transcription factor [Clostridiaceae bacterium]